MLLVKKVFSTSEIYDLELSQFRRKLRHAPNQITSLLHSNTFRFSEKHTFERYTKRDNNRVKRGQYPRALPAVTTFYHETRFKRGLRHL